MQSTHTRIAGKVEGPRPIPRNVPKTPSPPLMLAAQDTAKSTLKTPARPPSIFVPPIPSTVPVLYQPKPSHAGGGTGEAGLGFSLTRYEDPDELDLEAGESSPTSSEGSKTDEAARAVFEDAGTPKTRPPACASTTSTDKGPTPGFTFNRRGEMIRAYLSQYVVEDFSGAWPKSATDSTWVADDVV
ncbi:hypothetical protein EIP86_004857 [Pleurotus ostreatoroseus]|nr:hypothetical protein EIP86_004857 [Pleurotus ostreatoroseus]